MTGAHNIRRLDQLLLNGRRYKMAKGQVIQSSDDKQAICLVNRGYIKRYFILNDGKIAVQSFYGPGDIFPLTILFKTALNQDIYVGPETYHYMTMSAAELSKIDPEVVVEKAKSDPLLYRDLLSVAGKRLESNIQRLENISLHSSYHRVAHELVYLAKRFGQIKLKGTKICIPLTHQDIANILSVARETVSPAMIQLRKKGLIKTNRLILVPNIQKLEAEAHN